MDHVVVVTETCTRTFVVSGARDEAAALENAMHYQHYSMSLDEKCGLTEHVAERRVVEIRRSGE